MPRTILLAPAAESRQRIPPVDNEDNGDKSGRPKRLRLATLARPEILARHGRIGRPAFLAFLVLTTAAIFARGKTANLAVLLVFLELYPLFALLGLVLRM